VNREKEIRVSAKRERVEKEKEQQLWDDLLVVVVVVVYSSFSIETIRSFSLDPGQEFSTTYERINKRTIIQYDRSVGLIDFR
jgi:hypothetical protein